MPSVIEICNLSLARIGQGNINSLSEASPQAEQCSLFYANVRDALLRYFPWNFATKNVLLTQVDATIPGWEYAYQYPTDILHVRKVYVDGCTDPDIPFEFEIVSTGTEKYICTDLYAAYAKYTAKITDSTLFDPMFTEALTYKLALDMIPALTNSTNKTQEIMTKYQQAVNHAMLAGAIEGAARKTKDQQLKSARSYILARR